jgi:hypothetical protein
VRLAFLPGPGIGVEVHVHEIGFDERRPAISLAVDERLGKRRRLLGDEGAAGSRYECRERERK